MRWASYVKKIKNQNEDWLCVSAGGRLLHWRPGALLIRQKPPTSLRRSGCRLPTMRRRRGNSLRNWRNHRCAQAQELQERGAGPPRAQKPRQALAESRANPRRPAWLAYAPMLAVELARRFSHCRRAAFRCREWRFPFEPHPFELHS